jgi:hypothetical protein
MAICGDFSWPFKPIVTWPLTLLSDYYEVPSKTIILRLEEEEYITAKEKEEFLLDSAAAIYDERREELGLHATMEEPTYDRNASSSFYAILRENLDGDRISRGKFDELYRLLDSMSFLNSLPAP